MVSTKKRKYQEGYNQQECIEEHLNRNVDILMELATLQEKSCTDDEEKLRMSKALHCKKEFLGLKEECDAEVYITHAYRCTTALRH